MGSEALTRALRACPAIGAALLRWTARGEWRLVACNAAAVDLWRRPVPDGAELLVYDRTLVGVRRGAA